MAMTIDEMIEKYGVKSERILYEEDKCICKMLILNKDGIAVIKEFKKEKTRKKKNKESEDEQDGRK